MANLNPEDLPFLLNEETGIDWKMIREKFSGRSGLFFNNTNFGGRRGSRVSNGWDIPNLVIDPSVKYRAFGGSEYAADILDKNRISGGYNVGTGVPAGVFFNQGVPLWSYASTPNERYLIATLGENWGDRRGNAPPSRPALPDDWKIGGTKLEKALGDFGPDAIQENNVTIPSHNLTHDEKLRLARLTKEIDSVKRRFSVFEQAIQNQHSGEEDLLSAYDLDVLEKHIKKTNPKLYTQKALEVSDLQREFDELDNKIQASLADKNPDRSPIDASYERNDWRKEQSDIFEEIRKLKLNAYLDSLRKTISGDRASELAKLITPESKRLLIEHARWIDEVSKFKTQKLTAPDTTTEIKNLLQGNLQDYTSALASHRVSENMLTNLFSPIGYVMADSGLVGGSYQKAMEMLLDEITDPSKVWSDEAKTNLYGLTHHTVAQLPEFLEGFQISGLPFPRYTVSDRPEYLPVFAKPDAGVNPEVVAGKSVEKEGFFESPTGRYLLGPKQTPFYIGSVDDKSFATPQLTWQSKEGFGFEPINSDGNRITASQLQWPHIGKEGAMYSETLPVSTWQAPWNTTVSSTINEYELYDIQDGDVSMNLSTLQSLGADNDSETARRLANLGRGYSIPYKTIDGFAPQDGTPGVELPSGEIIKKIFNAEETLAKYAGSYDPGLLKLFRSLPPEKLKQGFWVKLKNQNTQSKSNPRTFQVSAGEIDLNTSKRPAVLFRVDPNQPNGFIVVREWNNEANEKGIKPIPIEAQTDDMRRNALIRFAQETIEPLKERTLEKIKQEYIEKGLYDYLMPEDIPARIESEALSELSQINSKFPWLDEYKGPEQWADTVMAGRSYNLQDLLYGDTARGRTPGVDQSRTKTPGYTLIQNLIDESIPGNPEYGKLGSNFGPQLERYFDDKMFQAGRDFKTTSDNIKMAQSRYANDAVFRGNVNRYIGERVPRVAVGALAGVQVKGHLDAGENIFQAVGNTALEFAAGIAKFNLYERFVGSIETMGDATIEGHMRRQKEALEIDRQWGEYLRGQDWTRWERDEKGNMVAPKIKPEIVKAMGEAHEKKKKEDAAKKATEQWNKENPVWVDGELNQGVL